MVGWARNTPTQIISPKVTANDVDFINPPFFVLGFVPCSPRFLRPGTSISRYYPLAASPPKLGHSIRFLG
jgi:hypothetical protein